jgi:hypothetical protein
LLFAKLIIIKSGELRWAELVARMRVKRIAYKVLFTTPGAKREFGKPTHKWKKSVKIDLT